MNANLEEVKSEDGSLDLAKIVGKPIARVTGRLSRECGDVIFVLASIVFEDGTILHCEGEHDMPYVTYFHPMSEDLDKTLSALWAQKYKAEDET